MQAGTFYGEMAINYCRVISNLTVSLSQGIIIQPQIYPLC